MREVSSFDSFLSAGAVEISAGPPRPPSRYLLLKRLRTRSFLIFLPKGTIECDPFRSEDLS